jgi:uncharacterized protein YecT (DUF1311 family)
MWCRRTMLARAVLAAVAGGSLAACSSAGSPSGGASSAGAPSTAIASATASGAATQPSGSATSDGLTTQFVYIVEPFDPGHPARQRPAPPSCGGQSSTVAIEQCYEVKTENADAAIDGEQLTRYEHASRSGQAAILAADSAWLSARQPVCAAAFHSGGTIDGIQGSACLLEESTARLAAVTGVTPPAARLKGTDSPSLSDVSWYTTPGGSRIGMQSSQGDAHGGAIVEWTVIGGADGFVVSPAQFPFRDGSFTDAGVAGPPNPAGHRVGTAATYQFSMDYTQLSKDPNASKPTGTYDYAPGGTLAAAWGA